MSAPATITVLYSTGGKFDLDYYLKTHMPMVSEHWTAHGLTSWKVLQFKAPDSPYQIQATLEFESAAAIGKAQGSESTAKLMGDIPNFTDLEPVLVGGEVVGSG